MDTQNQLNERRSMEECKARRDLDVEKTASSVQFSVLSADTIRAMSVVEVKESRTLDRTQENKELHGVIGGLADPHFGPFDNKGVCATCSKSQKDCEGHFGHIELAVPCYAYQFIRTVLKVLRCVCCDCSRLLLHPDQPNVKSALLIRDPKRRLAALEKLITPRSRCNKKKVAVVEAGGLLTNKDSDVEMEYHERQGCGCVQPMYTVSEGVIKYTQGKARRKKASDPNASEGEDESDQTEGVTRTLKAEDCIAIFENITDDDLQYLGFGGRTVGTFSQQQFQRDEHVYTGCITHPIDLLVQALPVPPLTVRPFVFFGGAFPSSDDLTVLYTNVVETNKKILNSKGLKKSTLEDFKKLLQHNVTSIAESKAPGVQPIFNNAKKQIKSLAERLKGKHGRVRGNLMGKRVDFSARSVITGDPTLSIDEVGVPIEIARNMTVPEVVTRFNRQKLLQRVKNGCPDKKWWKFYPGAKTLRKKNGNVFKLKFRDPKAPISIEEGDIVERMMEDGDYVLFNRQPSLHKMSMMGHKAKILSHSTYHNNIKTFRLNLSVTAPYNADFDGDEMNLHLPQNLEAVAEIKEFDKGKHIFDFY